VTSVNADVDALREFHAALVRFRYAQRDMISQGDDKIARVRESLAEKFSRWRFVLEHRQAELDACQSGAADDNVVDCSGFAQAVAEATERLEHVRHWQQRVDEQAGVFRGVAGRFRNTLDHDLPRAEAHLLALIANLEAVRGVQAPGS
jgi:hypothetical protein